MRIMIDTNVLVSIYLFPTRSMQKLVEIITSHTIVLPSYVINELKIVVKRKFPAKYQALDAFLLLTPNRRSFSL